MHIQNCTIKNYKGFRASEQIKFTEGFNVVVGQNNAGKTALIEALSLQFSTNLHKSLITVPQGKSVVYMQIGFNANESLDFFSRFGAFGIFLKHGETQQACLKRFESVLKSGIIESFGFTPQSFEGPQIVNLPIQTDSAIPVFFDADKKSFATAPGHSRNIGEAAMALALQTRNHIYCFRAERLNIHQSSIGTNAVLTPNASNLPEVLHFLQTNIRHRFMRFVKDVCAIFPDIKDITVSLVQNGVAQIFIWFIEPETERKDLAISLADCGTGIGQVLAMLYVVINSDQPQIILIDEPQSFLHPGAIRKLFEIFKREQNQKHQYIVTTHSPTVVTSCSPCNIVMLYRENDETKARTIDAGETADLRLFLSEIGARLSDVFGADTILWVEGKTEEICYQKIFEKLLKIELLATEIIGVTNVGDLSGRHKKLILEIYQKLCEGRGLLPPALGFCFDREKLSEVDMAQLAKDSNGLIQFTPRRMYENYLLNPKAIATLLNESDITKSANVSELQVDEWLKQNCLSKKYINESDQEDWHKKVDAAKLLNDLFNTMTETRVCYDKIKHGVKLTDWIIQNSPTDFDELGTFLRRTLQSQ